MCDEVRESHKEETNFDEKKLACKTQNFYIFFAFLLIAVSIYCYFIKYWAKEKHLLPFHFINNELKEIIY